MQTYRQALDNMFLFLSFVDSMVDFIVVPYLRKAHSLFTARAHNIHVKVTTTTQPPIDQ